MINMLAFKEFKIKISIRRKENNNKHNYINIKIKINIINRRLFVWIDHLSSLSIFIRPSCPIPLKKK